MASSSATTVQEYLDELPPERREVVEAVRRMVVRHLPAGYDEVMRWGMINYEVPLARYSDTYNHQPLAYVALAAQKNHYSLYLTCAYQSPSSEAHLREAFAAAGKKLDMGKSCVRFRKLDDLPLDAIGEIVRSVPPDAFIAQYEAARAR